MNVRSTLVLWINPSKVETLSRLQPEVNSVPENICAGNSQRNLVIFLPTAFEYTPQVKVINY